MELLFTNLQKCILEFMEGRTRVIVTSSAAVLSRCETVNIMVPFDWLVLNPIHFHSENKFAATDVSEAELLCSLQVQSCPVKQELTGGTDTSIFSSNVYTSRVSALGSSASGPFTLIGGRTAEVCCHPVVSKLMATALPTPIAAVSDDGSLHENGSAGRPPNYVVSTVTSPCAEKDLSDEDVCLRFSVNHTGAKGVTSVQIEKSLSGQETPPSIAFLKSWVFSVDGLRFAMAVFSLMLLESLAVNLGVYWLSLWSGDPGFVRVSRDTYFGIYGTCVVLEFLFAFIRQLVYATGTRRAADALHEALLFRIVHAPQSFFDSGSGSITTVMAWLTHDIDVLDRDSWYAGEYFWLAAVYGVGIVAWQLVVTWWVIVPALIVAGPLVWVLVASEGPDSAASNISRRAKLSLPASNSCCPYAPFYILSRLWRYLSSILRRWRPPVGIFITAVEATKSPLLEHFGATLEGLDSIRAYCSETTFTTSYDTLMDTHTAACLRLVDAQATRRLTANLIGAVYYIGTVAVLVPLRLANLVTAAGGGFIIVNSCFASILTSALLEQKSKLEELASIRGALIRRVSTIPQVIACQLCLSLR